VCKAVRLKTAFSAGVKFWLLIEETILTVG